MAQHDYNIANQGFSSFRSDLNNALSAIQTTNSGTSRPTGAVAGQLWLDTTTATSPTLKYYDGADDISLATIDHVSNTVNWLDSTVSITGLSTTATGTVLTLSDSASTSTVNLIIDNQKEIRFRETTANGTNYVALKAPASLSADLTFTLPSADGTNGQILKTNGSGVLSFGDSGLINGAVNWDTTPKTTGFTAVSGVGYFCNTTSSAFTVTLPSTPSAGAVVGICDYANTSATNNITVDRNSSLIDGEAKNAVIFVNGQVYTLVYVDATEGWKTVGQTFNQITLPSYISATGGTVTTCGDFKVHSFTGPGTFTVCSVGNGAGSNSVQVLMVAGGGGGEFNNGGGGGGGGAIFTPTASIPVSATGYPISIGGGGSGGTGPGCANTATVGVNTTGFSLTAVGGGFGGLGNPSSPQGQGSNGGSGGGDGAYNASSNPAGGTATQPTQPGNSGTFGNGFAGGAGGNTTVRSSGGGGGASAVGIKGVGPAGGNGGNGINVTPVFGSSPKAFYIANSPGKGVTAPGVFAGGGGGGAISCISPGPGGTGGTGGGGNGGGTNPTTSPVGTGSAGTTNSGGGGGGGANFGPGGPGGNGGSGIVLIRYKFQ